MSTTVMAAMAFGFTDFSRRLSARMNELATESGQDNFLMPLGLFLVVDKDTAEMQRPMSW